MTQKSLFKFDPEKNPLLAKLSKNITDELLSTGKQYKLPAESYLVYEEEESDAIFFLMTGEVVILKDDREIDRQGPGGVIGEMGVLTNQLRTASVKCITDIEVLRVDAVNFLKVVDNNPKLLRSFIRDMVEKMRGTHQIRLQQLDKIQDAKDILSRTVSPEVLSYILDQQTPEQLLEGSLNTAAILFFDIRGFSSAAEHIAPRDLLKALNEHLAIIIESVEQFQGTIVNFIGDAVLAIFNCPVPLKEPADAALNCYLKCQSRFKALHEKQKLLGKIVFELGAGINFGTVVSGAIGAENRFSYNVLGDEVNLAARLEGLTRQYPVDIILSETSYCQLTPRLATKCIQFDYVQVKGRENPVGLYTLTKMKDQQRMLFQNALELYLSGNFSDAAREFANITGKLSFYLAKRCENLADQHKIGWPGYYSWEVK